MRRRGLLQTALLAAAGVVLALAILLPFLWALSASLQTESALFERPPHWVPDPATTENYRYVFTGNVPQAYEVRGLLRSPVTPGSEQEAGPPVDDRSPYYRVSGSSGVSPRVACRPLLVLVVPGV